MYQVDFKKPVKVHFIGIGGISMSGLALILKNSGFTVCGSDSAVSKNTKMLEKAGIEVIYGGQRRGNVADDVELVIYSAAIHPDNPEYMEAVERNIPMLSRAEFLGELMLNYKNVLAVSGTHGKTTTTSMLSEMTVNAGLDPTIAVGGILPSIGGNIRIGKDDYFVAEACEYTNSFLSFYPTVEIILNIRPDHLDFFKDLDDIRHSFRLFAEKMDENGTLIINNDIEDLDKLTAGLKCKVLTFGINDETADYYAKDISYTATLFPTFTLYHKGEKLFTASLNVRGEHNVIDAVAASTAAMVCGISPESVKESLEAYKGVNRRFEKKGEIGGVTIVDDFAHHPDEIKVTLEVAKKAGYSKIWCVFQPYTYTRTKILMQEFADVLSMADEVVLAKIYPARETDTLGISSADLAKEIEKLGVKTTCLDSFDEIESFILQNCVAGELVLTMGCGDIGKVGDDLLGL
ncbi:MAG: UDP-N-acetylmuramate--L-alanine ligase [Lachnospiraceae bacterium]|nr:UDP-N-acetylmuramate--L-alanine ligase [Lachnospiraceae bacterium]